MKGHLTLANLLRIVFVVQLLALWIWGLLAWRLGTLLISTLLIALELWLENTREARRR